MAIIANLKKLSTGNFEGKIKTATLNARIQLIALEGDKPSASHPDYHIKVNGFEAGAGWNNISSNNNSYVSVQIDDPLFPQKIEANLIAKDDGFILLWERRD